MSAAVSSHILRYFGAFDSVASCKSANTRFFGLFVFTVQMYISSMLSLKMSTCMLSGDWVNAAKAFTSSTLFTVAF